jgi:hypothetical protein
MMEDSNTNSRIIQIIPAPRGMKAVYKGEKAGKFLDSPILCLALTLEGEIQAIDADPDGVFQEAADASNFSHFEYAEPEVIQ